MIRAQHTDPIPVIVGVCGHGLMQVRSYQQHRIIDEHPVLTPPFDVNLYPSLAVIWRRQHEARAAEPLFSIVAPDTVPAELVAAWAERVAELLERHGLADTPDTIRGVEV